jgi:hypothetical protein
VTTPLVDSGTLRRRRLRLARTLAGSSLRTVLAPSTGTRRQRVDLRGAADTLSALGIRLEVTQPSTPWPRAGRLVVPDRTGWLADRAVVAAALSRSSGPGAAVICPVAVRYRSAAGPLTDVPRTPAAAAAVPGLVVEVHCLPAVLPA